MVDNNVNVSFDKHGFKIRDNQINHLLLQGPCIRHLYKIPTNNSGSSLTTTPIASTSNATLWHQHLAHLILNKTCLISLQNSSLKIPCNVSFCTSCIVVKVFTISTNHKYK